MDEAEHVRPTSVEEVEMPPETLVRAIDRTAGLVVLPLAIQDGKAVYTEASVMLVKELRSLGADAEFSHSSDERVFEVRKSAVALVVGYVIGIASNASWDLMKRLLHKRADRRISVTYIELEDGHGQRGKAWKAEGDTNAVIQAIDKLREPLAVERRADDGSE